MSDSVYTILRKARSLSLLTPLLKKHGKKNASSVLKKDPFGVTRDVGATLEIADNIAATLGLSTLERIAGRLLWTQKPISRQVAITNLMTGISITRAQAESYIDSLIDQKKIYAHGKFLLHPEEHRAMEDIPRLLALKVRNPDVADSLSGLCGLTPEQERAVQMVSETAASIITGGPGTGKSHVVRALTQAHRQTKVTAPTGRAARNADGKTVHYFKTIQESGTNEFDKVSLCIVDEASMLSARLFRDVLEMTPVDCHIVLVGDVDQLPPIGIGDVLRDLLAWGKVPAARLTLNHRNATDIQVLANSVLQNRIPETFGPSIEFVECHTLDEAINKLRHLYCEHMDQSRESRLEKLILTPRNADRIRLNRAMQIVALGGDSMEYPLIDSTHSSDTFSVQLKKAFGNTPAGAEGEAWFDPGDSVVSVEAYDKNGAIDTEFRCHVSAAIDLIEPCWVHGEGHAVAETRILPNDPVIVTKNTDDACNGDILFFVWQQTLEWLDGSRIEIPKVTDTDPGFQLAYAITVHKSQGSEFDTVVLPVMNTRSWSHSLLYTAITRAKKKIIFMGSREDLVEICGCKEHPRPSFLLNVLNDL